jgi:AraC family transcriptional regulator
MVNAGTNLALPFGAFYGRVDRRISGVGLEIALLDVDPHRVVERHSHEDAHFVFVLEGLYLSSAQHAPPVSDGPTLIYNPPGTTHRDRFDARDRVVSGRFLTLSIATELVEVAHASAGSIPSRAMTVSAPPAHLLARRLVDSCARGDRADALQRDSLALELLDAVAELQRESSRRAPAWLARAREQLDDALGCDVGVADVAREVGVHPVHLARVFRQYHGKTPGDYLRRRRLEYAASLLRETNRPISDLAISCGFVDQSHLTTAFRRAFRMTPTVYRRRHQPARTAVFTGG